MIPSRRSRRSPARNIGYRDTASPSAASTARMRREQRKHQSSLLSSGSQRSKAPERLKPRSKAVRTRTMGTPPPVYMRGGMANLPVQPRKLGAAPKRRYNVALSVPGAELHLPAIPVLHMSWRMVSGVLTALLLALALYFWNSPKYRINWVEVVGLQRLTGNDINTVVNLAGQPIFAVNPQQILQDLQQAFPDMINISVMISLPAKVVVKAQERQPVITWSQDGREQWVDMEGMAFPPRSNAGKLIVVEAKNSPPMIEKSSPMDLRFLSPEMVGVILRMAIKAPKNTPLLYDGEHGLGWKDAFNCQVYFGLDFRDMEQKLLVYQALANKLQKDGVQPNLISVEYLHAPYYRLER